ncbi:putative Carboxypeptidase N subunit 2 [Hypsibius exemplaris]|uniref:Carboxypeptidase N subunit 2 n=1 Tax=Hypsibius exemplaris TaxID=2072580 RepID=A0A1W0X6L4_HYPEX|nr:putative Carboxypeptidase N subunit 2 [Hypsibius exemplaris]
MIRIVILISALCATLSQSHSDSIKCPILPSGRCWVDCNKEIHELICENGHWDSIHRDLRHYADNIEPKGSKVEFVIWNSDEITNVDHNLLAPILPVLQSIVLQDLINLRFIPMLRDAPVLEEFELSHCEQVTELDLSHLPPTLTRLKLSYTGITRLEYVTGTPFTFPHLTMFTYEQSRLHTIRGGFFKSFPALGQLFILDNSVVWDSSVVDWDIFATVQPLWYFAMSNNNLLGGTPDNVNTLLFKSILDSLNPSPSSTVTINNNGFRMEQFAFANFSRLSPAATLSLRDNHFINVDTAGLFADFTNLYTLDIGQSDFVVRANTFQGLPKLDTLKLDNNYLANTFLDNDMWSGSESFALRSIELEHSSLEEMPVGQFRDILRNLQRMTLTGNNIRFPEINFPSNPATTFLPYKNLTYLNLDSMGLTTFNSRLVEPLTKLKELHLSCNAFTEITKDFFTYIASDLEQLTLDFCHDDLIDLHAPGVHENAFTTLPRIRQLRLNGGFFRDSIFNRLDRMPLASKAVLQRLSLDRNAIRVFDLSLYPFNGFTALQSLSLKQNKIQSIGLTEFTHGTWGNLINLDLSENLLSVLQVSNFKGLDNLRTLNLAGNKLIRLRPGCFDNLKQLNTLMLHDNQLDHLPRLFSETNTKLEILMVERNPIRNVSKDHITALAGLKKLYFHDTKVETLEEGIFSAMNETDGHVISFPLDTLTCSASNLWISDYVNRLEFLHFVTPIFEAHPEHQHAFRLSHVPKCKQDDGSLEFITETHARMISHQTTNQTPPADGPSEGTVAGIVIGVLLAVALVGGIAFIVLTKRTDNVLNSLTSVGSRIKSTVTTQKTTTIFDRGGFENRNFENTTVA